MAENTHQSEGLQQSETIAAQQAGAEPSSSDSLNWGQGLDASSAHDDGIAGACQGAAAGGAQQAPRESFAEMIGLVGTSEATNEVVHEAENTGTDRTSSKSSRSSKARASRTSSTSSKSRSSRSSRAGHAAAPMSESLNDPLLSSPRWSARILCLLLGVGFLVAAGAVWLAFVRTITGQQYDEIVWSSFSRFIPQALRQVTLFFVSNYVTIAFVVLICLASFITALVRKRWELFAQLVVFGLVCLVGGWGLKRVLPRPHLARQMAAPANSSPSGHSVAAMAAALMLVMAVGLAWRWVASLIGWAFALLVGCSVVYGKWHRPSDVLVAFLFVTGIALLTLSVTRNSGMDRLGARRSSPTLQVVDTVLLVLGLLASCYGLYLLWQVRSGLPLAEGWRAGSPDFWVLTPAAASSALLIGGVAAVCVATVTIMRQVTASPLSAVGLVGAPPKPQKRSQITF
ncbi:phosphatase PAP2 family protein [Aeriscardovia aeriphila]|uniref:PAP2 family phosphoesterase n=1 Tax=Aeriscardovia aeriphila TaxID=218139 RepID=A0A261F7Y2_9BIFI|nr:phosphatase PAP2 family protein [Aeriscardovia aeriphila]NYI25277.1 membrane-associated phospholipid phosphatase [Aeriscardovia aeriphila]OZG55175.1 PAP2 family phosphoesterase [Aeriscardovia aeriphila]